MRIQAATLFTGLSIMIASVPLSGFRNSEPRKQTLDTEIERIVSVNLRLAQMVATDQTMRNGNVLLVKKGFAFPELMNHSAYKKAFGDLDKKNSEELKTIIKKLGWITATQFGDQAARDAFLLVQHADHDVTFQETVLGLLEVARKQGDCRNEDYAYLWDRVRVNKGELQRYGTQGLCKGQGKWEPRPMEDPSKLDERRKSVGLPPMSEYLPMVSPYCVGSES